METLQALTIGVVALMMVAGVFTGFDATVGMGFLAVIVAMAAYKYFVVDDNAIGE